MKMMAVCLNQWLTHHVSITVGNECCEVRSLGSKLWHNALLWTFLSCHVSFVFIDLAFQLKHMVGKLEFQSNINNIIKQSYIHWNVKVKHKSFAFKIHFVFAILERNVKLSKLLMLVDFSCRRLREKVPFCCPWSTSKRKSLIVIPHSLSFLLMVVNKLNSIDNFLLSSQINLSRV